MVVERTLGHIGAIDDVVQVDAAEADLVEDVDRGVDDPLLGDLGSNLHEFQSTADRRCALVTKGPH